MLVFITFLLTLALPFAAGDITSAVFEFDFNDNYHPTIITKIPSIADILSADTEALRLISLYDLTFHAGSCVGVTTNLDGKMNACLGDEAVCMRSKDLIGCMGKTLAEQTTVVVSAFDSLTFVIYTEVNASGVFSFDSTKIVNAPECVCSSINIGYKHGQLVTKCDSSIMSSFHGQLMIENSEFTVDLQSDSKDITHDQLQTHANSNNRIVVVIPDLPCLCTYDIKKTVLKKDIYVNQNLNLWISSIRLNMFVKADSSTVFVELPTIAPAITFSDKLVYFSLYLEGPESTGLYDRNTDVLVSRAMLDMSQAKSKGVVLTFKDEYKAHYVLVQVMYLDGTMLLTYRDKTWYPSKWCMTNNEFLSYCMPASYEGYVNKSDNYACSHAVRDQNYNLSQPLPLVKDFVNPVVYKDVVELAKDDVPICILADMDSGAFTTVGSTVLTEDTETQTVLCEYQFPPKAGQYRLYHTFCKASTVLICEKRQPIAKYVSNEYVSYIELTSDVFCPRPVVASSALTRTQRSAYETRIESPLAFQLSTLADKYYAWSPPLGHHDIRINDQLVVADATRDLSLIPRYCKDSHASMTYTHLPRFKTDHTSFVHIQITASNPRLIYALQVIKDDDTAPWLQILANTYTYQLESGTHYRFTLMVQEKQTASALLVTDLCYQPLGVIEPLEEIEIFIKSPVDLIKCNNDETGQVNAFVPFQVFTNFPEEVKRVIPYAHDDDIRIDMYSQNQLIYIAGPVSLDGYKEGSLVLEFKFGVQGQVTVSTIDTLFSKKLYNTLSSSHKHASALVGIGKHGVNPKESRLVADLCPMNPIFMEEVTDPNKLSEVHAHLQLVSDDFKKPDNHDIICSGKRLFSVVFDTKIRGVTFKTENDEDVGSIAITDASLLALDMARVNPVLLYAYYNPSSTGFVGVMIPNLLVTIAPPTTNALIWSFQMPQAVLVSSYESSCSAGASKKEQTGGMIIRIDDRGTGNFASDVQKYTFELFDPVSKIPIIPRSSNHLFAYSGMESGAFVGTLKVEDFMFSGPVLRQHGFKCKKSELFFVEPSEKSINIGHIVDMKQTYTGTKTTLCPVSMFADTRSWLEYYVLTLNSDFLDSEEIGNKQLRVNLWEKDTQSLLKTYTMVNNSMIESALRVRLPHPGVYIAEIEIYDTVKKTTCSHPLPEYSVKTPQFDKSSFVLEVISYPSCADSFDGIYRISYPKTLTDVLASATACFMFYDASQMCITSIYVDESQANEQGIVLIKNAPYVSQLTISFEVSSACLFSVDYTVAPLSSSSYVLQSVEYVPSCSNRYHQLKPLFAGEQSLEGLSNTQWLIGDTAVSYDSVMMFDPLTWKNKYAQTYASTTLTLSFLYNNDMCRTQLNVSLSLFFDQIRITPEVKIDPILFELDSSRSLPVYCPHAADAMLVATVYPPLSNLQTARSEIHWLRPDRQPVDWRVIDRDTVVAYNLAGDTTYELVYETGSCRASDKVYVPEKEQYAVLNHLVIEPATCAGCKARAYLEPPSDDNNKHKGCEKSEVDVFRADMLTNNQNRAYLNDNGAGSTEFTDVDDGTIIEMKIPYDPRYNSKHAFCGASLIIDFGKVAPDPVMGIMMNNKPLEFKLFIPSWHVDRANKEYIEQANSLLVQYEHRLQANKDDWIHVVEPATQIMPCSYSVPAPVSVYLKNNATGDQFLVKTYDNPYYDRMEIDKMINPDLTWFPSDMQIIYPFPLNQWTDTFSEYGFVHSRMHCNLEATMTYNLFVNDPSSVSLDQINLDGTPVKCSIKTFKKFDYIECIIPRKNGFFMNVPYTSSTGGSCLQTFSVHEILSDLKGRTPLVKIADDKHQACLMSFSMIDESNFTCFDLDHGYGVYEVAGNDPECKYAYSVVVNDESKQEQVDTVQVVHPSCNGYSDGAVVWKLPNETIHQKTNIVAGLYTVEYDGFYSGVYLLDPDPISFIVQPADFPAPAFKEKAADVVGIPYSMAESLSVIIYISGGSESVDITIEGTSNQQGQQPAVIRPECILRYFENVYWRYMCNSTLLPGYSYTFDVSCTQTKGKKARDGARPTIITTLEPLELELKSVRQPSTVVSEDGEFSVGIKGGVAPFTFITSVVGMTVKQLSRTITQGEFMRHSGTYHLTVIDAAGSIATLEVKLYPVSTFNIESMQVVRQTGSGIHTRTTVNVKMSKNAIPESIGFWNQAAHEKPVENCNDPRMQRFVESGDFELNEHGDWNAVVCVKGAITATSMFPLRVTMQEQTLIFDVAQKNNRDGCMVPCVEILKKNGRVRLWSDMLQFETYILDSTFLFNSDIPIGIHVFMIEDETKSPVRFEATVYKCTNT